ncbi:hypothetical protein DMUE_0980 [Dictyocoela muelleri]|nr:hypothetical protein DMUE_0980 [Dictyocoela muelleri]
MPKKKTQKKCLRNFSGCLYRYSQYLRNIKLKDFYFVDDYKLAVEEVIKRIEIHKAYTQKESTRIYEEAFLYGIENKKSSKFISEGISDVSAIYERITETGKYIISKNEINYTQFTVQKKLYC